MFMISSADFTVSLLGAVGASAPLTAPQEGPQPRDAARQTDSCRADLMTASGQFSCPPAGSFSCPLSTDLDDARPLFRVCAGHRPAVEGRDGRLMHRHLDTPTGYMKTAPAGVSAGHP